VYCYESVENCVASYWDTNVDVCELLVRTAGSGGSGVCPLGVADYDFGVPVAGGSIFPGPCGS
jgi:hypothetical protein